MKKSALLGSGIWLIGILFLVGCGQQTPSINTSTSNPQPQGLKIKGTVRTTTINGTVGGPVAGAYVSLSGDSANHTSTTDASGEYTFQNIPDGRYIIITTAEGHTRRSTTDAIIKPVYSIPADNTITVADIQLLSNPIILSISPTPNSVVGNSPTFTVTFNEAMDTSSVLPTITANGIRAYVATSESAPLSFTWAASRKVLTIVPQAPLISNESYILAINNNASDESGYIILPTPEQALALSQNYRVTVGGVPSAPSNVTVVIGTKVLTSDATGADYVDIVSAGNVGFNWSPSSGVVTGYKVYISDASTHNYHLIAGSVGSANYVDVSMANILNALYGATTINPLGTANFPMINMPLYVKVIAYNGDGESAAASTSAKELVGPQIINTGVTKYLKYGYAGGVMNDNEHLPAINVLNKKVIYVGFLEPLDAATVISANFSITAGGGTSVTATLLANSTAALASAGFTSTPYSIVKLETTDDMNATTEFTVSGVKDLAGNAVKLGQNDTIILTGF